jgi:hypothetical protein
MQRNENRAWTHEYGTSTLQPATQVPWGHPLSHQFGYPKQPYGTPVYDDSSLPYYHHRPWDIPRAKRFPHKKSPRKAHRSPRHGKVDFVLIGKPIPVDEKQTTLYLTWKTHHDCPTADDLDALTVSSSWTTPESSTERLLDYVLLGDACPDNEYEWIGPDAPHHKEVLLHVELSKFAAEKASKAASAWNEMQSPRRLALDVTVDFVLVDEHPSTYSPEHQPDYVVVGEPKSRIVSHLSHVADMYEQAFRPNVKQLHITWSNPPEKPNGQPCTEYKCSMNQENPATKSGPNI